MKITGLTNYNMAKRTHTLALTGGGSPLGYDDEVSSGRREFIREHIEYNSIPYYEYHKQGRVSEYALNKLIKDLNKYSKPLYLPVDDAKMESIGAASCGKNCYRGRTLVKTECLPVLKKANIKTVIDLVGYTGYEEACKKNGLNCFDYPIKEDYWRNPAFFDQKAYKESEIRIMKMRGYPDESFNNLDEEIDKKVSKFKENFFNFINTIKEDYFYIGCEFGTGKTDEALCLNYVFNPNEDLDLYNKGKLSKNKAEALRNLYKNLTDEDKKRLGYTKEFDEGVFERIKEIEESDYY